MGLPFLKTETDYFGEIALSLGTMSLSQIFLFAAYDALERPGRSG